MNPIATKIKNLRERKGLSLQQLAEEVGVAKQSIHKFEKGTTQPSSSTLLKLAEAFSVPFAFFYEQPSTYTVELKNIQFREKHKIENASFEAEVKTSVCTYITRLFEMEAIMEETRAFENPLVDFLVARDADIERAAKQLRKKWKIGQSPLSDVVETLENKGIVIVEVQRSEEFTGLSGKVNNEIPVIVLNEQFLNIERKRFTALHELAHILLSFAEGISEKKLEWFCDAFAGAVLIVEEALHEELGKRRTVIALSELKRIKEIYGISIQAIIMRAKATGWIDYDTFQAWWKAYDEWRANENMKNDFGNYVSKNQERPTRFNNLIVRGVSEGRLSISKAAELAGKKKDIFRRQLDELKFSLVA